MENNNDLISYSDIYKIIYKNRFFLLSIFVVGTFLSAILFYFIPPSYSVSGFYKTPSRAYFDSNGMWVEEPYESIELTILKYKPIVFERPESCKTLKSYFISHKSSIKLINPTVFEVNVIDANLDCAKSTFNLIESWVSTSLTSSEMKVKSQQNTSLLNFKNFYDSKSRNDISLPGGKTLLSSIDSPFSVISPAKVTQLDGDLIRLFKYGFIAQLIFSFVFIIMQIVKSKKI